MSQQLIGRYQILKLLGSGGFGAVYLAHDPNIKRDVAIKIFKPKDENLIAFATSSTEEGLKILSDRFNHEAHILSELEDATHIINVHDFGKTDDGSPYYVMPYLSHSLADNIGKDVFDVMAITELSNEDKPKALPLEASLTIIEQIIDGLAAAHKKGLVHRDIKPANILITDNGHVRIADFGIAKAPDGGQSTVSQLGMGSRNYMAPEQRESAKHVDSRADIYSLGVLAYRIISARLPTGRYPDLNVYQTELSTSLNALILQCLSENRDDRPTDGTALLKLFRDARSRQAIDDEATGATKVDGPAGSLRDEVVPLEHRIRELLIAHGELPISSMVEIKAMAAIADVDEISLRALEKKVSQTYAKKIRPKRNFIKHLVSEIKSNPDGLDTASQAMLISAAQSAGWNKEEASALVVNKIGGGRQKTDTADTADIADTPDVNKFGDDIFGSIFGAITDHTAPIDDVSSDVNYDLQLSISDAFTGCVVEITVDTLEICNQCDGAVVSNKSTCDHCGGRGRCNKSKTLSVKIPSGVSDGSRIRLSGQGHAGVNGQEDGDLYVVINFAIDEVYTVKDYDLYANVYLGDSNFKPGRAFIFNALDGQLKVKLPKAYAEGQKIRLAGKGLRLNADDKKRGNLYLSAYSGKAPEKAKPILLKVEASSPALKNSIAQENIGIETVGGVLTPLVEKGQSLQSGISQTFSTAEDDQQVVSIKLYRGNTAIVAEAAYLGSFDIGNIMPAKKGEPQIEVTILSKGNDLFLRVCDECGAALTIKDDRREIEEVASVPVKKSNIFSMFFFLVIVPASIFSFVYFFK
jgi:serine/threonine protein kinase